MSEVIFPRFSGKIFSRNMLLALNSSKATNRSAYGRGQFAGFISKPTRRRRASSSVASLEACSTWRWTCVRVARLRPLGFARAGTEGKQPVVDAAGIRARLLHARADCDHRLQGDRLLQPGERSSRGLGRSGNRGRMACDRGRAAPCRPRTRAAAAGRISAVFSLSDADAGNRYRRCRVHRFGAGALSRPAKGC